MANTIVIENEVLDFKIADIQLAELGRKEIQIAEYGVSNTGRLKNIYRRGLRERYGSAMQCVSGIHYNFSLSKKSWQDFFNQNESNQTEIDRAYFGLIRNVKRNYWLIAYLFGASPICHQSFLQKREHELIKRKNNPQKKLVGLELVGKEIAGHGDCVHIGRSQIGVITSGCLSSTLNKNIALCRMDVQYSEIGIEVEVGKIDGHQKRIRAKVVGFRFYDPTKSRVKS